MSRFLKSHSNYTSGVYLNSIKIVSSFYFWVKGLTLKTTYVTMTINHTDSDCPTPALRLSGGSGVFEGRVEICGNGLWGTVSLSSFDSHDATVVCRELGFLQAGLVTSEK